MAVRYYLQNGKNGESNTLNLLINGSLKKDFIDIAHLDLETMKIDNNKKTEILTEYNKGIDLSGSYFDASFPHKTSETKTYESIFGRADSKTQYYINQLREFAERRKWQKDKNEKLVLKIDKKLEDYIRLLVHNIILYCPKEITDYNSIMAVKFKEIIREKIQEKPNIGIDNYINSKSEILKSLLSNYTQLRNATISYILYLERQTLNRQQQLNKYKYWQHHNMYPTTLLDFVEEEYEQLSFFDKEKVLTKK